MADLDATPGIAPPLSPATIFGRDDTLALLDAALVPGTVTALVGPPGVGKSTLAAALAARRGAVVWVDVAGATSAADLWGALASALGLSLNRLEEAHQRIAGVLAGRDAGLVVLDAAEHLDPSAWAEVEALARGLPGTTWAVTTVVRPAGRVRVFEIAPLAEGDAVALLVARARERALDVTVEPTDPVWVALAERLSGLPLALELAAGRFGVLTAAQILERLDRPRVLAGGRHGSVEGALRYAWGLLADIDRDALVDCSVFRGGFDVEAAEGVLGDEALDRLTSLRERSALAWRDGRFHVLDGLRRLAESEGGARLAGPRARHAAFFADRAEALVRGTRGPDHEAAGKALLRDRRNLEAAYAAARDAAPVVAARIAACLLPFYWIDGPVWGADLLGDVAAHARAVGGSAGARLLAEWGVFEALRHGNEVAGPILEEAAAAAESTGDVRALDRARYFLVFVVVARDGVDTARALAVALSEAAHPENRWMGPNALGLLEARAGDLPAAGRAFEDAIVAADRAGNARVVALARGNLAQILARQGRNAEARPLAEESARALEPQSAAMNPLLELFVLNLLSGDPEAALGSLRRAEAVQRAVARPGYDAMLVVSHALLRWAVGDRAGARDGFVRAMALPHVSRAALAQSRAFAAILEGGPGLPEALVSARADGCDPDLLAVLDAWAAGEGLPPHTPIRTAGAQLARFLLAGGSLPWRVDAEGRWFERPGGRVDLSRRGAMRRILAALVSARRERPGVGLTVDELVAAGWPGEKVHPEAAAGRVYTAIRELRGLGLEPVLQRRAEGYLLDPAVELAVR